MNVDDLFIVNYCHPNCEPLKNIMWLPKDEAFALAHQMAEQNKDTTAFYRFADFENYYFRRLKTDELLYTRFIGLGGKPAVEHALSFVLMGSEYLADWFDRGTVTKIPLRDIPSEKISFTYGDSMTVLERQGDFTMLTKDMLARKIADHPGTPEDFVEKINEQFHYIEVQVWDRL